MTFLVQGTAKRVEADTIGGAIGYTAEQAPWQAIEDCPVPGYLVAADARKVSDIMCAIHDVYEVAAKLCVERSKENEAGTRMRAHEEARPEAACIEAALPRNGAMNQEKGFIAPFRGRRP